MVFLKRRKNSTQPFLKSQEKDATDPVFYRPIALLSVIRKVCEQILKSRRQTALEIKSFENTKISKEDIDLLPSSRAVRTLFTV